MDRRSFLKALGISTFTAAGVTVAAVTAKAIENKDDNPYGNNENVQLMKEIYTNPMTAPIGGPGALGRIPAAIQRDDRMTVDKLHNVIRYITRIDSADGIGIAIATVCVDTMRRMPEEDRRKSMVDPVWGGALNKYCKYFGDV